MTVRLCEVCGCPAARWLSVSQVAATLGCSARKIRRLLASGEIEGLQLGRGAQWRIDHRSLDRYVRKDSLRFPLLDEGPQGDATQSHSRHAPRPEHPAKR